MHLLSVVRFAPMGAVVEAADVLVAAAAVADRDPVDVEVVVVVVADALEKAHTGEITNSLTPSIAATSTCSRTV